MDRNAPIFRERYPKQVLYFIEVNTNRKLETRTKGIVNNCSALTCTKKYALTEGPKRGGGGGGGGGVVNVGHPLSSPQSFYACYGSDYYQDLNTSQRYINNPKLTEQRR